MGWKFKAPFCLLLLLILILIPAPDRGRLLVLQAAPLLEQALDQAVRAFPPSPGREVRIHLSVRALTVTPPELEERGEDLFGRVRDWAEEQGNRGLSVQLTDRDPDLTLNAFFDARRHWFDWTIAVDTGFTVDPPREGREFFSSWISLVPPLLAILLAVLLSRTLVGLLIGALLGSLIVASARSFMPCLGTLQDSTGPVQAMANLEVLLWELVGSVPTGVVTFLDQVVLRHCLLDSFRRPILLFVVFLSATVGVMTRMGGVQGLVEMMRRRATTMRSTQLATYLMGLAVFFDDYANTIVVGNTMRPLTDRFRLAREKLAYIVDSTSAPVAGLAYFSTWIAYEVSTFSAQLPEVGIPADEGYSIFARTIPFRFYCIFTLALVLLTILTRREFGPMARACDRALTTGDLVRKGGRPMVEEGRHEPYRGPAVAGITALVPPLALALTLLFLDQSVGPGWTGGWSPLESVIYLALVTGGGHLAVRRLLRHTAIAGDREEAPPRPWAPGALIPLLLLVTVTVTGIQVLGLESVDAILWGSLAAFLAAAGLALGRGILTAGQLLATAWSAARSLSIALAILVLAWAIGWVCKNLGTAPYLVASCSGILSPTVLPLTLFFAACLVSFSTGSSWSTMAILLPNVVILAHTLGADTALGPYGLMILSIGAVLEGAIFGDHCSPISDTTILSSVSAASDHLDHTRTQMPYALLSMGAAVFLGYLPVALLGLDWVWITLPLGVVAMLAFLLLWGRVPGSGSGGPVGDPGDAPVADPATGHHQGETGQPHQGAV